LLAWLTNGNALLAATIYLQVAGWSTVSLLHVSSLLPIVRLPLILQIIELALGVCRPLL
jgi:hypothetical protein